MNLYASNITVFYSVKSASECTRRTFTLPFVSATGLAFLLKDASLSVMLINKPGTEVQIRKARVFAFGRIVQCLWTFRSGINKGLSYLVTRLMFTYPFLRTL